MLGLESFLCEYAVSEEQGWGGSGAGIFLECFRALALRSRDADHGSLGCAPWGELGCEELRSAQGEVSGLWKKPLEGGWAFPLGSEQVPEHIRWKRERGTCRGRHS